MKKIPIEEHSFVLKNIKNFDNKTFFIDRILQWETDGYSISKIKSHLILLCDLVKFHGYELAGEKYNLYWKSSQKGKLLIRYGNERVLEFEQKLKERPKPKSPFSILTKEYWMSKGLSENDASNKVSEIQRQNSTKRTKTSYKNHSSKIKYSLGYWTSRGYSIEESELLREPYLRPMLTDLDSFIERHGKTKGKKLYDDKIKKYKKTCEENKHTRKSAGYVSRESLNFFIKLYKKCRRLGLKRDDIYFGIDGSKEFFIRHKGVENKGRFFDFTIPSISVIIEYNGVFWHPRRECDWNNPWITYDDAMLVETEKKNLCLTRNYDLFIVWSDDDLDTKLNELFTEIKQRYERTLEK